MKHVSLAALAVLAPLFLAQAPAWAQANGAGEGPYVSLRAQQARQQISGQQAYSPRALGITRDATSAQRFSGALALGYRNADGWRGEIEYVAPVNASFETQWRFRNPVNGFTGNSLNTVQTRTQRLMVNIYKDYELGGGLSAYGGLGAGWSSIEANGYQNTAQRRFDSQRSNNLAWSATVGLDYRLTQNMTMGVGYRYVALGKYATGRNSFLNNASGQRDEQHRGRMREQDLFVELRAGF